MVKNQAELRATASHPCPVFQPLHLQDRLNIVESQI